MIKINSIQLIKNIPFLLLFLFAFNFMGQAMVWLAGLFAWLLLFKNKNKMKLNDGYILLLISMTLYAITLFLLEDDLRILTIFSLAPTMTFLSGQLLLNKESLYDDAAKMINVIMLGMSLHGLGNIYLWWSTGSISALTLNGVWGISHVPDIWNDVALSATGQVTHFVLCISLLFWSSKFIKNKLWLFLVLFLTGAGLFNAVQIANRTLLFTTIIIYLMSKFLYEYTKDNSILTGGSIGRFLIQTLFMITAIYFVYDFNIIGVQDIAKSSSLYIRMLEKDTLLETPRWEYQLDILSDMFDYPFGGNPYYHYAHNLWIDVLRKAGIAPMIFLAAYFVVVFKNLFSLIENRNADNSTKIIFTAVIIATTIDFSLEPILEGTPYYFFCICIIHGALNLICNQKVVRGEEKKIL